MSAIVLLTSETCSPSQGSVQPTPSPNSGHGSAAVPHIVTTHYPTDDLVIANLVVTDPPYKADNSGVTDATFAIQAALNAVHAAGGGVVWLPSGKYRVTSSITIPQHVTLRGDWRDPDVGSGPYGAVVLATPPTAGEMDPGLFRVGGSAGIDGLTIYYPDQSPTNPVSYAYAVEILGTLVSGFDFERATVEHLTLLDAYRGISAGAVAVHALHTIRHVRGTALLTALYLQDSSDISRNEDIEFGGTYWSNIDSSLTNSRPAEAQVYSWTRDHATGLRMGGLDWDHFLNLSFSDFNVGIDMAPGRRAGMTASLFGIKVRNSHVAFHVIGPDVYPWFGLNIANSTLQANQGADAVALQVDGDQPAASVILNNVTLDGGAAAAKVNGNLYIALVNCTFDAWNGPYALVASRGTIAVEGATFVPPLDRQKGIDLLPGLSSATVLGSTFTGSPSKLLDNQSSGVVFRQDSGFLFVRDPLATYTFPVPPRPSSRRLYDVRAAPYRAAADGVSDDTAAIQRALSDAGRAGGGTVYLRAGIYAVRGHLTIPAGVELRGSDVGPHETAILERAPGTILFAYEGRSTAAPETATPFILLNGARAGLRGLSIHYPEQATDSPAHMVAYPWTIRGNGQGVSAFDVSLSNAYQALDFSTNPTSHHLISDITGFALKTGVKVGSSSDGWVEDVHWNSFQWGAAQALPGGLSPAETLSIAAAYSRVHAQAFVVTEGAQHERLIDDGVFGVQTGLVIQSDAQLEAINIGVDGSPNSFAVENTGQGGATLVNLQGCGCRLGGVGLAIKAGTVNLFNLLTIEAYQEPIAISGGAYQIEGAGIHHSFAAISAGTGVLCGAYFEDSGTQVTVSGASTIANLWGNTGGGGFNASFVNGAQRLASGNIPR